MGNFAKSKGGIALIAAGCAVGIFLFSKVFKSSKSNNGYEAAPGRESRDSDWGLMGNVHYGSDGNVTNQEVGQEGGRRKKTKRVYKKHKSKSYKKHKK